VIIGIGEINVAHSIHGGKGGAIEERFARRDRNGIVQSRAAAGDDGGNAGDRVHLADQASGGLSDVEVSLQIHSNAARQTERGGRGRLIVHDDATGIGRDDLRGRKSRR